MKPAKPKTAPAAVPAPEPKTMALVVRRLPITQLQPHPENPRIHPEPGTPGWETLSASLDHDYFDPVVWNKRNGFLVSGHFRRKVMLAKGVVLVDAVVVDYDEKTHKARLLAANKLLGADDDAGLAKMLRELQGDGKEMLHLAGYHEDETARLLKAFDQDPAQGDGARRTMAKNVLVEKFGVPPFSILDARQGYWQTRKAAWLDMGIKSEVGRDVVCNPTSIDAAYGRKPVGVSIFDPVLCELAYRWFCPEGGKILDIFAGGSVRGIVAGWLGYSYTGIDLSKEQITANEAQAKDILGEVLTYPPYDDTPDQTPVENHDGIYVKRDDMFCVGGIRGGKVRSCYHLAKAAKAAGKAGLTTAGSRASPQVNIVARIAKKLGMACVVHTPEGDLSPEVMDAQRQGAEVKQHKAGFNNVIVSRAREFAEANNYAEIPFGMECSEAVQQTRKQAANLPRAAKRLVVPVGSGMSLAGILHGMLDAGIKIPVVGIVVGADPEKRLDQYAPTQWREMVTLIPSGVDYHEPAVQTRLGKLQLDPVYEAKCLPFLEPGDCLWVVGIRATAAPKVMWPTWVHGSSEHCRDLAKDAYDFLFTCPPYFDLEVYSNKPEDISNAASYEAFLSTYRKIIAASVSMLRQNRFACIVVGDIRDKKGFYRNFVADTIAAYRDAGMEYYNEGILITPMGSLPVRMGKQFPSGRKFGKAHQNVLVFFKGDPDVIKTEFPIPETGQLPEPADEAAE